MSESYLSLNTIDKVMIYRAVKNVMYEIWRLHKNTFILLSGVVVYIFSDMYYSLESHILLSTMSVTSRLLV